MRKIGEQAVDLEKERQPKTIHKLHFLANPGWLYEGDPFAKTLKGTKDLSEKYIEKARELKLDELMVAFAPAIDAKFIGAFRNNPKAPFAEIITQIKKILGDRLIVLADSDDKSDSHRGATFEQNKDKVWKKIKTIAEKRGFSFSDKLSAEAYGELIGASVRLIADNMHQASGMSENEPVIIQADLTDYPMRLNIPALKIAKVRKEHMGDIYLSQHVKINFGEKQEK
jgi:hypothetical protein